PTRLGAGPPARGQRTPRRSPRRRAWRRAAPTATVVDDDEERAAASEPQEHEGSHGQRGRPHRRRLHEVRRRADRTSAASVTWAALAIAEPDTRGSIDRPITYSSRRRASSAVRSSSSTFSRAPTL